MIIDGKKLSLEILDNLRLKRAKFKKLKIAAFLIGEDREKISFLKIKQKFADYLNIDFKIYSLDDSLNKRQIRKYISQIINHKTINGGIVQLPISNHLPVQYILNSIPAKKDIDCLCSKLLGRFYTNTPIIRPPVVEVVDFLREKFLLDFEGKNILIIGYGRLIGKPLVHYFSNFNSTLIVAQSKTNLRYYFKDADVIIAGVGKRFLVDECKEGAVLIDFGYQVINKKIYGDLDFDKLKDKALLITPTPNGTGPILVAKLFENFFKLLDNKLVI